MDIGPGDEVIVPALTFVAPAAATRSVGARPVFADIKESDWTIDPDSIRQMITSKTKAIISVDVLGHPCDYDELLKLGIPIIEDAAQAHGALYKGKRVGGFGLVSTFSFHANKIITTGEGGCVLTNDEKLALRMRIIAGHGMTKERPYWHSVVGSNYRMTNITAAIGFGQITRWDELVAKRSMVREFYDQRLANVDVEIRPTDELSKSVCWLYTVCSHYRDGIVEFLRDEGIDARAIWPSLCKLPLYKNSVVNEYPVAKAVSERAFWLPTWTDMPEETISYVVDHLIEAINNSNQERER